MILSPQLAGNVNLILEGKHDLLDPETVVIFCCLKWLVSPLSISFSCFPSQNAMVFIARFDFYVSPKKSQ